jgi:hypothetical protein
LHFFGVLLKLSSVRPELVEGRVDVSLCDGFFNVGYRTHGRDTFLCTDKEKYPKEIRPMPLVSCALAFLSGFAKRHFPVPLAKRSFHAAPLRVVPDKNTSARRGIRDREHNRRVD